MGRERWSDAETEIRETRVMRPQPPPGPPPRGPVVWPWLLLLLVLVLAGLGAVWYFTQEDDTELKPVPVVTRLTEQQARERLETEGFGVGVTRAANEAPNGIVFAQDPGAGQRLEEGSVVQISVSEGPATSTVPSVVGLPLDEATARLREAELRTRATQVFSEEPEGIVVSQSPAAGEEARRDSAVRVNVSKGPGETTVPDLVGLTREEAEAALEEARLSATVVEVPSDEPADTVVAQNPPAGQTVRVGGRVRLNVSTGG
jgi:eukaryotic-like serine/threonine-protein kinase